MGGRSPQHSKPRFAFNRPRHETAIRMFSTASRHSQYAIFLSFFRSAQELQEQSINPFSPVLRKKKKEEKKKNPHYLNFVAKTNSLPQNEGTASIIWQQGITKVSVLSKSKHCSSTLRQYHQKKVPFSFVLLLFATFSSNPPARTSPPPLHFHTEAAPTQNETSLSTLQRGLLQAWARCQQRTDAGSRLAPSRELPSPLWASRCSPDNAVTDALPRTAAPPPHRGPSLAPGRLYLPENIHQDLCAPIMKNLDQAESFKNVSGLQKHKLRNNAPKKPSSPWCF